MQLFHATIMCHQVVYGVKGNGGDLGSVFAMCHEACCHVGIADRRRPWETLMLVNNVNNMEVRCRMTDVATMVMDALERLCSGGLKNCFECRQWT
jgi:hypothetical protein